MDKKELLLPKLIALLNKHPAFSQDNSHLEKLAKEFGHVIVWAPKFTCELNPIEGLWCDTKKYVRKYNEQDYSKLFRLIEKALDEYEGKKLNIKLWYRFWRTVEMYNDGCSYEEVLTTLFGAKSSATVTI